MKKSNQHGFAALEVILIVVIIAIIGFVGYYVWHVNKKASTSLASSAAVSSESDTMSGNSELTPKQREQATDPTASWKTFTSPAGAFSIKYPATWVQPAHKELCNDGMFDRAFYVGPNADSVLKCATENFGQISLVSKKGDTRFGDDLSVDPGFKNVKTTHVTINNVKGTRAEMTAAGDPGGEGDFSVQAGPSAYPLNSKVVQYMFFNGHNTYVALYVQTPGTSSVLSTFDTMIQDTLKF